MAALIISAAMLDVIWWVPAHRGTPDAAAVQTELPQCKRARLEAEAAKLEAELEEIQLELDRLPE